MTKGWKIAVGVGLLGLLGGAAGGWFYVQNVYDFPIESGKLDERVKAAREAGVPLTLADLGIESKVPDSQNAYPLLAKSQTTLRSMPNGTDMLTKVINALWSRDTAALARLIPKVEGVMEPYKEAASRPETRNPSIDWEYPTHSDYSSFMAYRQAIYLLCARAQLRVSRDDLAGAYQDIETAKRLLKLAQTEPFVIGGLFASVLNSIVTRTSVRLLATQFEQGRPVRPMVSELTRWHSWPGFDHAARSEAFYSIQIVRNLDRLGGLKMFESKPDIDLSMELKRPTVPARTTELPTDRESRGSMARVLESWTLVFQEAKGGPLDPKRTSEKLESISAAADKSRKRSQFLTRSEFTPFLADLASSIDVVRVDQKLLRVYGLVLAYRQERGRWPHSLAEAGVMLLDPVDEKPFGFEVKQDGFRIWSVALKGVDGRNERPQTGALEYPLPNHARASRTRP